MQLIEAFVRNPVKVSVGVLMVALFGLIALDQMPMQLTPEVQTPTLTIETRWPGASPQEVEREIVQEQEDMLKSVEGVTKMSSESMDSMGRITLEFLVGMNMDEALLKVNSRLQQVREYPVDADQPVITTANSSDRPIAWFIFSSKLPTPEGTAQQQKKYREQGRPELADALEEVRRAHNPGLAMLRLRLAAKEHPELKELLPPADLDVTKMRRYAEDVIQAQLDRVPGVSQTNVIGGLEDELQVVVDPERLAARGVTIQDVRAVLSGQNKDTSAGDFWEGKRRWVVRTLSQFRSPEQVENQLLTIQDGAPVYVRDVAEVRLGYKKPDGLVRRFGESSVAINALRETGANVLDVMDGLRETVEGLNENFLHPQGLQLLQVYDETEYIDSSVNLVQQNIFIGGALTMIVLMLFLHRGARTLLVTPLIAATAVAAAYVSPWFFALSLALIIISGFWFARGALVVGLAIPTSIVGTFLVLGMLGRTLNVISLAGMAFAVGMLVDNAVVVLENIYRHYHEGDDPLTAAVKGTQEVWGAVAASTLTTVAVFLPVIFVQEEAGQLFRDIALAISASVALSLVVSMTLIPTFAARLFGHRRHDDLDPESDESAAAESVSGNGDGRDGHAPPKKLVFPAGRGGWRARAAGATQATLRRMDSLGGGFTGLIVGLNGWIQRGVLRRLAVVVLLVGTSFGLSYALWPKVEYLPTGNRNLVFGILLPPPGYNLDQLMELGETVEEAMRPYWDVVPDSPEARELDFPPIGDFFFVARGRQVFLGVRAADMTRAGELVPLIQRVGAGLPGTFAVAKQSSLFEQGLTAGRTVDVEITGPELEKLIALGGQVFRGVMVGVPGPDGELLPPVVPGAQAIPRPSLDLSSPEVHIEPKLTQAAELGVNSTDLGYTVNALVDGAYAGDYFVGGQKIDLTIMGGETFVRQTQDLQALPVATPIGQLVPLGALADVRLSSGPEQVNRRERQRAITIEVSPPADMPLEEAMLRIEQQILQPMRDAGQLDGGYMINLAGTADKLRDTWKSLQFNVFLALLITYLLMAALFESWLYPFVIILSVPLGAVGGILGLLLLNQYLWLIGQQSQSLDVLTMLGFVILIGTVVNNAILIVHQSLNHMRHDAMTHRESILESVRTRIRPIFMTTTTTVLGLMPLVLFPGAGSELYRGLGSVVLGGLIVSTVFTLFLVPTMFSLTMDAKAALLRSFRRPTHPESRPTPEPREPAAVH